MHVCVRIFVLNPALNVLFWTLFCSTKLLKSNGNSRATIHASQWTEWTIVSPQNRWHLVIGSWHDTKGIRKKQIEPKPKTYPSVSHRLYRTGPSTYWYYIHMHRMSIVMILPRILILLLMVRRWNLHCCRCCCCCRFHRHRHRLVLQTQIPTKVPVGVDLHRYRIHHCCRHPHRRSPLFCFSFFFLPGLGRYKNNGSSVLFLPVFVCRKTTSVVFLVFAFFSFFFPEKKEFASRLPPSYPSTSQYISTDRLLVRERERQRDSDPQFTSRKKSGLRPVCYQVSHRQ